MFHSKTKVAIRVLTEGGRGDILQLDDLSDGCMVYKILIDKHPLPRNSSNDAHLGSQTAPPNIHPIVYNPIGAQCIRNAALRTHGSGGPTATDTACWR